MCAKLLKSNPQSTTKWSGGDTTELFISPKGSSYKKQEFNFRISTATVAVEESVFTPLSGISRVLMVLDGQMNLVHKNHHKSQLSQFDVDRFDGGWETASFGTCVDFNLMLRNGFKGDVEGISLEAKSVKEFEFDERPTLFFYLYRGELNIGLDGVINKLNAGDLLCLEESECFDIELVAITNVKLVVVKVY
jgi:environmental stress-induced protein Ves